MRTFNRTLKCREDFPVETGEEWGVRDGKGKLVEKWRIIARGRASFVAKITELVSQ